MEKINEIKLPEGVDRIAVKQYDDKIVIEFIRKKNKFKEGDKVKIKDEISIETHGGIRPHFPSWMDKFIGKELTVTAYRDGFAVAVINGDYSAFLFHEDWIEPYTDEPKKGDLAIFWDDGDKGCAIIKIYDRKGDEYHRDSSGSWWGNALKFESKEQFEKVLRGEI